MRSLLFILLFVTGICSAQVPQTLTIQVFLELGGSPLDGIHSIAVSWYNVPAGGTSLFTEDLQASFIEGVATITTGTSTPLPPNIFLNGPLWIGFGIDGSAELIPRTMIASVPYAMLSQRALIADALSAEVTGVVTSINEAAGALEVVGERGIDVVRDGQTLRLSLKGSNLIGKTLAEPGKYQYRVQVGSALPATSVITAVVHSLSFVGVWAVDINVGKGEFTLLTAAPLQADEWIEWVVHGGVD